MQFNEYHDYNIYSEHPGIPSSQRRFEVSKVYPVKQLQLKPPPVLVQIWSQSFIASSHSFISVQIGKKKSLQLRYIDCQNKNNGRGIF